MQSHYYRNHNCLDGTIDYKLVELSMSGSYESSTSSINDSGSGSDNAFFLPSIYLRNEKLMIYFNLKCNDVKNFKTYYINEERITSF